MQSTGLGVLYLPWAKRSQTGEYVLFRILMEGRSKSCQSQSQALGVFCALMKAILISFLFEWQSTHNSGMVFTTHNQVSSTVCGRWERNGYPVGHPALRWQIQSNPTMLNAHLHQTLWSSAPVLAFNHPIIFALREKELKQKVLVYLQIYQSFIYHLPCRHSQISRKIKLQPQLVITMNRRVNIFKNPYGFPWPKLSTQQPNISPTNTSKYCALSEKRFIVTDEI